MVCRLLESPSQIVVALEFQVCMKLEHSQLFLMVTEQHATEGEQSLDSVPKCKVVLVVSLVDLSIIEKTKLITIGIYMSITSILNVIILILNKLI